MFGSLLNLETGLWDEFQRLQREMDTLFDTRFGRPSIRAAARGGFPAVNIGSTPEAVYVYAFAPGLDTKTLDVSMERNLLTIRGERKTPPPEAGQQTGYYLRERFNGEFRRVISLPDDVNPEQVNASYRNGVLSISIAKQETAQPRQIEITNA